MITFVDVEEARERIGELGANILQIAQSRGFGQVAIGETEVELILETTGPDHIERLCAGLRARIMPPSPCFSCGSSPGSTAPGTEPGRPLFP